MSSRTARKSLDTRRLARSTNSGTGLDGSLARKYAATASNVRKASSRERMSPTARAAP